MLCLLFQLGPDRYALDARRIATVLPLVAITPIPQSPRAVVGVCNYRGAPVPVIDLSELVVGRPSQTSLATRLILVHYPDGAGARHLLGLLAERATDTLRCVPADFVPSGVSNAGAPYLGPVSPHAHGLIQWIDVETLLPVSVRDVLFADARAG